MSNLPITKSQAASVIKESSLKMGFKLSGHLKRKDRKKPYSGLRPEKGMEFAHTVPSRDIFGGNARNIGPLLTKPVHRTINSNPQNVKFQEKISSWNSVKQKFDISDSRYDEFKFLQYLDIENLYVQNYVKYNLELQKPMIVGRLRNHLKFWETLNTPKWILDIIEFGFTVPFHSIPPKMFFPNSKTCYQGNNFTWLTNTIEEFLEFKFISEVDYIPYCVLPLQIAEHPDKLSLIHDESPLNQYIEKDKFKLESWEHIFPYCFDAKYAIKFDLKKFYFHIEIHPSFKKYFGFSLFFKGKIRFFIWNVLPYGYTRAPLIARHLLKPLISKWRLLEILNTIFFDDGFGVSNDKEFLSKASLQIHCDLIRGGLIPGLSKCTWTPTKILDWCGFTWDFELGLFKIKERRVKKFLSLAQNYLDRWPNLSYRNISKIVGMLTSMGPVFQGLEQLRSRYLQGIINVKHFKELSWDETISSQSIVLFQIAKNEIKFWLENLMKYNFRYFIPPKPTREGWVDASKNAGGGLILCWNEYRGKDHISIDSITNIHSQCREDTNVYNFMKKVENSLQEKGTVKSVKIFYDRFDNYEIKTCSNERELNATLKLLLSTRHYIKDQFLTLHLDNQCAVSAIIKGSRIFRLHDYSMQINDLCLAYNITLKVVAIPRYINNVADCFSKCIDNEDYSITFEFFHKIQDVFKVFCNIDRFANFQNKKINIFNSAYYCPGTSGVDAFNYDWGKPYINFMFPPPRLILNSINHLLNCKGKGLLLAPDWKSASFYPYLKILLKKNTKCKMIRFKPDDVFIQGSDPTSFFGPNFNCAVNVYYLDFTK